MFYYYGGKANLARRYPNPVHPVIIEPFAGAAGYSMHHLRAGTVERAFLVEKDPRVAALWRRLLAMTIEEVAEIPVPIVGEKTSDFFHMTTATSNGVARCTRMTVTSRMPELVKMMKRRVIKLLPHVAGRVTILEGDYTEAPSLPATWFIDPPYQPGPRKSTSSKTSYPQGMGYARGCDSASLDYSTLANWCRSRPGQVIAVEANGADWLPFRPMTTMQHDSQGRHKIEMVWTSTDLAYRRGGWIIPNRLSAEPTLR